MKANSSRYSHHIKKQVMRDKKYFIYHSKKYPVNFDILKNNCNYFYQNQEQFKEKENIELLDEKEKYIKLTPECIQAFIKACQNEPFSFENSSIIHLQYLAHKYEYNELIQFTDKFIEYHSEDLVFDTLFFKVNEMEEKENNDSFFDTSKEEQIISVHLSEFLQKEETKVEMLKLPIPLLYRVLKLFSESQHDKNKLKNDVIDFLFKCLDKYGRPASILFNLINFKEQRIELINRLIGNYLTVFDFNQINQTLAETVQDLTKQKEEYYIIFKQMQEAFNKQLEELKEMKKHEEEKQIKNENENQKRIENFSSDVNKIKNNVDETMKSIQDQFKQICIKQEEFIDNAVVKKYHQMILETITFRQFLKLDDELKDHFKTELETIEQKNKEESLHAKVILDCVSIPELYENIPILQFFKGDIKNHSKIKITNNLIEDLNQKKQLESCLTKCVNISNDILVEIECPCNKFEQKMKILKYYKNQYNNIRISLTITDNSYFEQAELINNADDIKCHEMLLESIPFGQFRKFDDKSRDLYIKELYQNENEQKNENELLRAKLLLDLSSIPDSYDYNQIVDFLRKNENNQTKFKLTKNKVDNLNQKEQLDACLTNFVIAFNDLLFEIVIFKGDVKNHAKIKIENNNNIIEDLNQNEQLDSFLTKCVNISNDLLVEIEYPCNKFEQIMKTLSDIKTQKGENMKVSVTINDKSYFEQKYKWNKIVNIFKVGKSIDVIPEEGFCDFCNLSDIELSPNIVKIGPSSFKNCTSLTEIKIPNSVKSIGDYCFDCCQKLDRVTINPFYTKIQFNTFNKCHSLKHFEVSTKRDNKSKTNERILIQDKMIDNLYRANFFNSLELTSYINECAEIVFEVQYPSNNFEKLYEKIANFKNTNKTKIKISIFITGVEKTDQKFNGNEIIDIVRIDSSVKEIKSDGDKGSFEECSSLTQIIIPTSVTSIGEYAFKDCSSLIKIEIPSSITSIGPGVFSGCQKLNKISITVCNEKRIEYIEDKFLVFKTKPSSEFYDTLVFAKQIEKTINIPSFINIINGGAMYKCSSLTQITIPSTVTSIGNNAFSRCSSLTQITIPSSVTSIGSGIFTGCPKLDKISIVSCKEKRIEYIEDKFLVFKRNVKGENYDTLVFVKRNLNTINIPSFISIINGGAMYKCSSLTQITIPSSVTSIGDYTFYECSSLTQITIPSSVTSIGDYAFYNCKSLAEILIPSSVTSIGKYAFGYCYSLTQVSLPPSLSEIGGYAFAYCEKLGNISIPSSITSIKNGTFTNCRMTQIYIPSSVTSIGDYVFQSCCNLSKISFETPSYVTSIGNGAFRCCNKLTEISIPSSVTSIGKEAFSCCSMLARIAFASSLTFIGQDAFSGCKELTQISIPSSVTYFGRNVFRYCEKLNKVSILSNNEKRIEYFEDKFLIYKTNANSDTYDTLLWANPKISTTAIPSFIKIIGESSYEGFKSLTQITIPSSVTSIGNFAFYECSSLTQITFSSSVNSIGNHAFQYCSSLTKVTFPSSLTSIGDYVFSQCKLLEQISIPSSMTSFGSFVFSGCPKINNIKILSCNEKRIEYFENKFLILKANPENSTYDTLLWANPNISTATIPSFIKIINKSAFSECKSLTQVTIPSSVISIDDYAFYYCESLAQIIIPSSVISIGYMAFRFCNSLKQILIPSSVTSIGEYAIEDCNSLREIKIPSSILHSKFRIPSNANITVI